MELGLGFQGMRRTTHHADDDEQLVSCGFVLKGSEPKRRPGRIIHHHIQIQILKLNCTVRGRRDLLDLKKSVSSEGKVYHEFISTLFSLFKGGT